ncbi:MAG TPA: flagellar motor switch protein FliG [Bryobacteraceae bacterium]|nr:flagellar motor switch protein FliG [Bryobacteraceae bacterium]
MTDKPDPTQNVLSRAVTPGAASRVLAAPVSERECSIPGSRKAAILLMSLGDEASAAVLRQLTVEQVHDLTREISTMGRLNQEERQEVLADFLSTASSGAGGFGGVEYATSVLLAAFGPETGKRMAERLLRSMGGDASGVDLLRKVDPQQLAKVVQREHPQTVALIVSNLDTVRGARLLAELPDKLQAQVVRRVAALDQVSPEVTSRLAKIVGSKLRLVGESASESFGGTRTVAEMLNRIDPESSEVILKEITNDDPELGQEIRQIMFVFEDLLNIPEDSLRKLLGKCDRKVLTLALKGGTPQLRKHFASAMSQRSAEMLAEDMEALGPVRLKDVQSARQALVATARQMADAGEISLSMGMEQYVE